METKKQSVSMGLNGKTLKFETGELAKQAQGAVVASYAETVVLATIGIANEPREAIDFFPLTVEYRERTYAAGKIPGGFFKREGRPREKEVLTSRLIDRPLRPLFDERFRNEVQVMVTVLSVDTQNDPDVLSICASSLALGLAGAPFAKMVAGVRVGKIEGQLVLNPTTDELKASTFDIVVAGTKDAVTMIEGGAYEVSEEEVLEAIKFGHKYIKEIVALQEELLKMCGANPKDHVLTETAPSLIQEVETFARPYVLEAVQVTEKKARAIALDKGINETIARFAEKYPEQEKSIKQVIDKMLEKEIRRLILEDHIRLDRRTFDQIRDISAQVGVLPRTHGSAIFTRGQTQALVTTTLGTMDDRQIMDELEGEYKKKFMLHYNFPPFATGEVKPLRGTGRREIGHGALAEKSLSPILPSEEKFPYTVRIVADILESNGSSSMASVCGGTLSLMDAGVPISDPVAGISIGLVLEKDKYATFADISGHEDHYGDMDFKVAGTRKGITAIQLDVKVEGLSFEILAEALEKARKGRLHILAEMTAVLPASRKNISSFAPKICIIQIPTDKIKYVIGPGGKVIKKIIEDTKAEINIEDDGKVFVSGPNQAAVDAALEMIGYLTADAEIGRNYTGKVTRLMNFGAFVEILPGKEGLVHISQLAEGRTEKVEDVVKEGDEIEVKVVEIDSMGRINLSRKAVLREKK
ncbi:MAG: polyribonucleotide nucleotidyltransferase [Elusimicrobia bacterium]|nr:polyribonucleotide nucleotidyltransferase [Elusimicrobiota bacterium]